MKAIQRLVASSCAAVFALGMLVLAANAPAQLLVADFGSGNVFSYTSDETQGTFVGGLPEPLGLAFDSAGDLFVGEGYVGNSIGGNIIEIAPGGAQTVIAGLFGSPSGLAFDNNGNLFLADAGSDSIYKFAQGTWSESIFASGLIDANSLAFNSAGDLFAADNGGTIDEYAPDGTLTSSISGTQLSPVALAFNAAGDLFVANGSPLGPLANTITEIAPDGTQSTFASGLDRPRGLAFDSSGDLFVANSGDGEIIKITPTGGESIFASGLNDPQGLAFENQALPVPEPSPLVLFVVGATGLLFRRR